MPDILKHAVREPADDGPSRLPGHRTCTTRECRLAFSGSRMARWRVAAGLTQVQLADVIGTKQERVSDWERGVTTPRPQLIPMLAEALGLDALLFLAADPGAPDLADLRLAAGLSSGELAAAAGITVPRYRRLELGAAHREPAPALVEKLAQLLALPVVTVRAAIEEARK